MPVYNGEKYIDDAINSVISQSHKDWKLLVVNDSSTDLTASIVNSYVVLDSRISLIDNKGTKGAAGARNYGMSISRGDYVAFIDCDDVWHSDKLKTQIELMQEDKADFSYTSYEIIDSTGSNCRKTYMVPERITFNEMLKENYIGCSTVIVSGSIAKDYIFSTDFYHEDYCLWLQLLKDGFKAIGCSQPLVKWRFISGSRSSNKLKSAVSRWRIYRKRLNLSFILSVKSLISYVINGINKYSK